ncbi:hypothetical protein PTI98_006041 [Pleurotus ostreatus]|nr:hypothetical protein PTI98_006041 [Pleurotus ostreatus]
MFLFVLALSLLVAAKCNQLSVRKECRNLSQPERRDWITAVKCLAGLPHSPALTPTIMPDDIVPVADTTSSYYDGIFPF